MSAMWKLVIIHVSGHLPVFFSAAFVFLRILQLLLIVALDLLAVILLLIFMSALNTTAISLFECYSSLADVITHCVMS